MKNYIIYTIFLSLLLVSCSSKSQPETSENQILENELVLSDEQIKNADLAFDSLSLQNLESTLKVNGKISLAPQSQISLSIPLGGYLTHSELIPGMPVKKGQILATIEDPQYIQIQQDYLSKKAQFAYTENEYKRQIELNTLKANSDKTLELSKANFQTLEIEIKSLEEKLKLIGINPNSLTPQKISKSINVYSPIDGIVAATPFNIGKYVNPSDVLFELLNPLHIYLTLYVFENDIHKLSVGQMVESYSNFNPNQKINAQITFISPQLNNDGFIEVNCKIVDYNKDLIPGLFMNAIIKSNSQQSYALKNDAVVRYKGLYYVFIKKDANTFLMHQVQLGNTQNNYTEILNYQELIGKHLVTQGAYNLLMAMKNNPEE